MPDSLTAPAVQLCAFALGSAVIDAARAYAAAVTYLFLAAAAIAATTLLLSVSLIIAQDHEPPSDERTVSAEFTLHPVAVPAEAEAQP